MIQKKLAVITTKQQLPTSPTYIEFLIRYSLEDNNGSIRNHIEQDDFKYYVNDIKTYVFMPIQTKQECNHFITTLRQTMMIADISDDDLIIARIRLCHVIKPPHLKLKDVMSLAMLDTEKLKNPKLVNEVITQNVSYEVDQLIKGYVKLDFAVGKQCLVLQNEVYVKRNLLKLCGFLGDRGYGQWGFVGEARVEYSNGHKYYGTWGDIGNGQWGLVGRPSRIPKWTKILWHVERYREWTMEIGW